MAGAGAALWLASSPFFAGVAGVSVAAADGDGYAIFGAGVQDSALGIVGEGLAAGSQAVDQFRSPGRPGDLAGLAGLAWTASMVFLAVKEDSQGCQVGQDLVLADVGVLRPAGVGLGSAGVPMPAPVGRAAVRP